MTGLFVVGGDGHHRALHQLLDVFAAAGQQLAQATGHRGQHHVVDRGVVGVGDPLGDVQAPADDRQAAAGAGVTAAGMRRGDAAELVRLMAGRSGYLTRCAAPISSPARGQGSSPAEPPAISRRCWRPGE
jgi:hypothetical protein